MFIEIPRDRLERFSDADSRMWPYLHGNVLMRRCFWLRLRLVCRAIRKFSQPESNCLDFGGGNGVFLPSLASHFRDVVCIDLDTSEAEHVVASYGLTNVALCREDIRTAKVAGAPFSAIVATDVLEHFSDLAPAASALWDFLDDDGILFTSLPTENFVYAVLRRVFGVTKPHDHYHTGYEVEEFLARFGFVRQQRRYVPLILPLAPLFIVSVWRKGKKSS